MTNETTTTDTSTETAGEITARKTMGSLPTRAWRRWRLQVKIACVVLVGLFTDVSYAKDLSSRLGVGYKNQFSADLPGFAVQYFPGADVGVSAALGVDTQKDNSRFGIMGKVYRIIFHEENLNFYMGAGAGILSQEAAGKNESGFELMGFAGAEFFFSGMENLGFSFEAGTAVTSLASGVRFRTFGDHPLRAGMMFYF